MTLNQIPLLFEKESKSYCICTCYDQMINLDRYPMMIKIQYSLNLPAGVDAGDKPTSKTHEFKVDTSVKDDSTNATKSYYDSLWNALKEARDQVGDELTMWRDFVDKKELSKGNGDEAEEEEEGDLL